MNAHVRLANSDYLHPILHCFKVTVKFSLARGNSLILTLSLGVIPANIAVSDISLKLNSLAYISATESIGISSTTVT